VSHDISSTTHQLLSTSVDNELTLVSLRLLGRIDHRQLVLRLGLLLLLLPRTGRQLEPLLDCLACLIR
jgi:hypothetical protein